MIKPLHIAKGKKRPGLFRRRWPWSVKPSDWLFVRPRLSDEVEAGTNLKLCGISSASLFRWKRWGVQRHRGPLPLQILFSTAWEDSDRIVGIVSRHDIIGPEGPAEQVLGLELRAYAYRAGIGATAPRYDRMQMEREIGPLSVAIGFVPNNTGAFLEIGSDGTHALYAATTVLGYHSAKIPYVRPPSILQVRHGFHADGYRQRVAPARLDFDIVR